jgi:hypothetical protein
MCKGVRGGQRIHESEIHVGVHRIRPLIADKLHKLRDPAVARAVLDRWLAEPAVVKRASMQQTIEARLAELDAEEASLDRQARGAMRLAASEQPGVADEAERVLAEVNTDRLALKTMRDGLNAQLARLPVERSRSMEVDKLNRLLFNAEGFADGWRLRDDGTGLVTEGDRELLKAWVDALGPPVFGDRSATGSNGSRSHGRS